MVRIIARFADCPVLIVGKEISLCLLDAVLESGTEQVILPVSPPGHVDLRSTALFGRGSALTPYTHRIDAFRVRSHDLFDSQVVLPVVTEVIFVQKPLAEAKPKIYHANLPGVIVKAHAPVVGDAVLFTVDEEAMEMTVRPPPG
jgi:hypothetical protein